MERGILRELKRVRCLWVLVGIALFMACSDAPVALQAPEGPRFNCDLMEPDPACESDGGGEEQPRRANAAQLSRIRGILDSMSKEGVCAEIHSAGMDIYNTRTQSIGGYWVWDQERRTENDSIIAGEWYPASREIHIWTGTSSWERTVVHEAAHAAGYRHDDGTPQWAEENCI